MSLFPRLQKKSQIFCRLFIMAIDNISQKCIKVGLLGLPNLVGNPSNETFLVDGHQVFTPHRRDFSLKSFKFLGCRLET